MQLMRWLPGNDADTDASKDRWYSWLSAGPPPLPLPNMPLDPCTSTLTPSTPAPVPFSRRGVQPHCRGRTQAQLHTHSQENCRGPTRQVGMHLAVQPANIVHHADAWWVVREGCQSAVSRWIQLYVHDVTRR